MVSSARVLVATVWILWGGAGSMPALAGAPTPVGDELRVNGVTDGRQLRSAAAALGNGEVVVVWEGEDSDGRGVFGRRVDTLAQPLGSEIQVSVGATGDQVSAEVAPTGDGGFLVVWESDAPGATEIRSRYFDASATPGPEVVVAPSQAGIDVSTPAVDRMADGTFVVIWDEYDSPENDGSVRARFLTPAGSVAGSSFTLPTDGTSSNVFGPELGSRRGDGFLVAWEYVDSPDGLWAQSFTGAAAADGVPLEVTPGGSGYPRLAGLDGDGFMVVWASSTSVAKRRSFDAAGTGAPEVDIDPAAGSQRWLDVAAVPGGGAAVIWTTSPSSGPTRIDAQRIGADSQVESEWRVDESSTSLFSSRILYDAASGHLVATWTRRSSVPIEQEDIYLRRYDLGTAIFLDGFESGGTTAWSSVFP
ncbi:MAG: hypothetical protein AAGD06_16220 [Acidobacteriota bacterium]